MCMNWERFRIMMALEWQLGFLKMGVKVLNDLRGMRRIFALSRRQASGNSEVRQGWEIPCTRVA
jgi:hypothetical protein